MKLLQDLESGEPVIDFKGNLVLTDITRAFRQYLDVLFHTPIFEEVSLPTWGLPIREIFQALNPRYEPLIDEIKSIDVERDGSALSISVHVTSIYGTETTSEVNLNE